MINEQTMIAFCKYAEETEGGIGKKLIKTIIGAGIGGVAGKFLGPAAGKMFGAEVGAKKMSWLPLIGKPIGHAIGGYRGASLGTQHGWKVGAGAGALGGFLAS